MERKTLPQDQSLEALFGPNRDWPYLQESRALPDRPSASFDAANAWRLAELSMLCYVPEAEFVRARLASAGLTQVQVIEGRGVHCIVAGERVVFRGTVGLRDALTDLDALLVEEGAGQVHRGFRAALDELWDELSALTRGRAPCFAGHSLGGALAVLAAARHPSTRCAYTFGAPRIGDTAFRDSLRVPVYRVVNNNDIVTRMPPPLRYRHVGSLKFLDAAGVLREEPDLWERVREQLAGHKVRVGDMVKRWLAGDFQAVPYASLVDHAPQHYVIHLWNHLVDCAEGESASTPASP